MSINKAILIGNLGSDPEVKSTTPGKTVASFSLATSERYKDRTTGEAKSITDWHNVVLWGSLANIAGKYLKKGSKIYLEGRIKSRSYESNGVKKYITEIVGDNITMLGERQQPSLHVVESAGHEVLSGAGSAGNNTDDLPF
jgi:single-strand DNA-binding protein